MANDNISMDFEGCTQVVTALSQCVTDLYAEQETIKRSINELGLSFKDDFYKEFETQFSATKVSVDNMREIVKDVSKLIALYMKELMDRYNA